MAQKKNKVLTITSDEAAEKLLGHLQERFAAWHKDVYETDFEFDISDGATKYWEEIGLRLYKKKIVTAKKRIYEIKRSLDNSKLFSEVLKETPSNYGPLSDKKKKRNKHSWKKNDQQQILPLYRDLVSRKWLLFAFTEVKNHKTHEKYYRIHRSIIQFSENHFPKEKNKWKIKLWALVYGQVEEYNGGFGIRKTDNGHIYLESTSLELEDKNKKHLRMMLYFGLNKINPLGLGVYYNIRYHGALLAGSSILVEVKDEQEYQKLLDNKAYVKTYSEYEELEENYRDSIWKFFERRSMNYIKLPNLGNNIGNPYENHSLENLERVIAKHQKISRSKEVWLNKFFGFISIPLTYLDDDSYFQKNKKFALQTIDLLSELFDVKPDKFFFAAKKHDLEKLKIDKKIPHLTLSSLERSKVFILLLPKLGASNSTSFLNKISSSFTELGYAMALKKKIIIIGEEGTENILPNNLKLLIEQKFIYLAFYKHGSLKNYLEVNKEHIKEHLKSF